NLQNNLANYEHTLNLAIGAQTDNTWMGLSFWGLAKFFLSQFAVAGPLIFPLMLYCLYKITKAVAKGFMTTTYDNKLEKISPKCLAIFSIMALLPALVVALFSRSHGNWAAPAYITLVIL